MTDSVQAQEMDISLEAVELELALQLQDIVTSGFAESVQGAVEAAGYTFLFQMPAVNCEGSQKIAAISAGAGEDRRILLVHLDEDGQTVRVEAPEGSENSIAELAASYAGMLEQLNSIAIAA